MVVLCLGIYVSGRRPDTTKVWNFINHFREEGIGSKWMSLPQWFKVHDYITLASGKLFHPAHPPLDDYPTSWTTDPAINPWYWGNQAPIGDASPCGSGGINSANITHPLREKFGNGLACYNTDSRAMADDDNKTVPQLQQRVEYAHRLATRTIEYMAYAKAQGKNFYIGVGIRKVRQYNLCACLFSVPSRDHFVFLGYSRTCHGATRNSSGICTKASH